MGRTLDDHINFLMFISPPPPPLLLLNRCNLKFDLEMILISIHGPSFGTDEVNHTPSDGKDHHIVPAPSCGIPAVYVLYIHTYVFTYAPATCLRAPSDRLIGWLYEPIIPALTRSQLCVCVSHPESSCLESGSIHVIV